MDMILYEALKYYIRNLKTPSWIPDELKYQILNTVHEYYLQGEVLRWIKNGQDKRVAKATELEMILHNGHSSPLAGHYNAASTKHRIMQDYYWPKMGKIISDYVQRCDPCQRRGKPKRTEGLNPIQVTEILEMWGMDIVGPLPETKQGNKYIIVATEYLSKWPVAQPLKDIKAGTVAEFFHDNIICQYGAPKIILTDQGSSFNNEMFNALCGVMEVKHKLSAAYHPQTNGLTERFNKTLCQTLAKFIEQYKEREWDTFIQSALFAYRTREQSTTKYNPFFLMYGKRAQTPLSLKAKEGCTEEENLELDIDQYVEKITTEMDKARIEAKQNITRAQVKQKIRFDKKIKGQGFQIGDQVLLYKSNEDQIHGDKFRSLYSGPYYIDTKLGNGSYKLRDPESNNRMKKVINGARLKKYYPRPNWQSTVYIEN